VVVGAPFLPLAVLLYWVANNLWTLGQQYVVYRRIDAEETEKKAQVVAERQARAPRPGQKPVRTETPAPVENEKTPGAKPVTRRTGSSTNGNGNGSAGSSTNGAASRAATNGAPTRPATRRPRKRR
jgi:YidC/Oxa1 family membrane protein insertase